jgi:low temperature requirement protein LtrA
VPERGDGRGEVRPVELFFDLVYVLAITQLTHHLLEHLTLRGALETFVLLLAVWGAWINTAWITNYFDLAPRAVRLVLLALMLAGLVMSAAIPEAFDAKGPGFVGGFLVVLLGGTGAVWAAVGRSHHLGPVFERVLVWWSIGGVVWLAGLLVEGDARLAAWGLAAALMYGVMWIGFPVPGLGRARTTDYTIAGEHMAHRCLLFVILALGESILVTGSTFGELPTSAAACAAFAVAFAGSVAFWWIYFDRGADAAARVIAAAPDPGRLGLRAYTYVHIAIVAGVIVAAAADELALAHPGDEVDRATAAVILGGPLLYLAGSAMFKRSLWGYVPLPRTAGMVALAALVPLAAAGPPVLLLLGAATAVIVGVAVWETLLWRHPTPGVA